MLRLVLLIWQVSAGINRQYGISELHSRGYRNQVDYLFVGTHVVMVDLLGNRFLAHVLGSSELVALESIRVVYLFLNLVV